MLDWGAITDTLWQSRLALLHGVEVTLSVSAAAILIGAALGAALALIAVFAPKPIGLLVAAYVYVLRGLPLLVTIFFIYYGLAVAWRALPPGGAVTLAMSLFAAAAMTEIFRGAIQSIPHAQLDAAKAIGLPFLSRACRVVAPLAIRRAIPSLTNVAVEMVKASTLVSALGIGDLLLSGQEIAMRTLMIPETYLFLWLVYFLINAGLTEIGRRCEERYRHVVF